MINARLVIATVGSLVGAAQLGACHRGAAADPTPLALAAVPDTARGIVRIVGNMPFPQVIIAQQGGSALSVADGPQRELLKGLSGVEVMVSGKLTGETNPMASPRGGQVFRVDAFEVRAVDGVPARDGVLEIIGGVLSLRATSGEHYTLREIPPSLRGMVGARVFLVGPMDQAPASYGVIARAP